MSCPCELMCVVHVSAGVRISRTEAKRNILWLHRLFAPWKKRDASDPQWARTESFEHAKDNFPVSYHCLEHDMGIAQAQGVLAQ